MRPENADVLQAKPTLGLRFIHIAKLNPSFVKNMNVAIVGASGAVGQEFLRELEAGRYFAIPYAQNGVGTIKADTMWFEIPAN